MARRTSRLLSFTAALALCLAGCSVTAAAASTTTTTQARRRPPPLVVVLGDSTALSLGYALSATAPAGTTVVNKGLFACGLAVASRSAATPGGVGLTMVSPCNEATPPEGQWPALDTAAVANTAPGDQVLFLAGPWETQSLLMHGRWENLDQAGLRAYELGQLRRLVALATAHGAHLDLLTMPCTDGGWQYARPPGPPDSPQRRQAYDALLEEAAREAGGKVSVIDYGSIICPTGHFQLKVDGVQVRATDGVHTPSYDPGNIYANNASLAVAQAFYAWLGPRLWPLIVSPPPAPSEHRPAAAARRGSGPSRRPPSAAPSGTARKRR